jgi:hypothetical protein
MHKGDAKLSELEKEADIFVKKGASEKGHVCDFQGYSITP